MVPILVSTAAADCVFEVKMSSQEDGLFEPVCSSPAQLRGVLETFVGLDATSPIDLDAWEAGRYSPTPTIIEAARALYGGHSVEEISRSDADATNLAVTSETLGTIIENARLNREKVVCFVTGVPGAGKTLVGLNIANSHRHESDSYSVFLSGNGPLVSVLCEALTRDKVAQAAAKGGDKKKKSSVKSEVKAFIQNVHHFRDECLLDDEKPPVEHVALFDEAQRAWNVKQTASFMKRKKGRADFNISEPEFLISCMDRHRDWAVVVCLVGGGQEINTGEAGISEWLDAIKRAFPDWHVYISPQLNDREYAAGKALERLKGHTRLYLRQELHLGVSLRSFRAENVSKLVKEILDQEFHDARSTLSSIDGRYPIVITRNIAAAKDWVRHKARGTERYGLIVSSQAERLKPHAIHVRAPIDPIHWFLDPKSDTRSSYYMEDVATEFHIQGLELDWACVAWDADFRFTNAGWEHWSFRGNRWNRIRKAERQTYLKNAYRVLLTRARQGMVIVVPTGDQLDRTRDPAYYDATYDCLKKIGFPEI